MTKAKFTLALEYFNKSKEAKTESDKEYYYSQYMNEVFRVDKLYEEEDKLIKSKQND